MEFQGIDKGTICIISPGHDFERVYDIMLIATLTIVTIIFIIACLSAGFSYIYYRFPEILHQLKNLIGSFKFQEIFSSTTENDKDSRYT